MLSVMDVLMRVVTVPITVVSAVSTTVVKFCSVAVNAGTGKVRLWQHLRVLREQQAIIAELLRCHHEDSRARQPSSHDRPRNPRSGSKRKTCRQRRPPASGVRPTAERGTAVSGVTKRWAFAIVQSHIKKV